MKEKRQYIRVPVKLKIKYSKKGDTQKKLNEAMSRDISQGGLLMVTAESMPIGAELNLEINFPNLSFPIQTEGRVVRAEEIEKKKSCEAGITFTKIAENDAQFIKEYIQATNLDKILDFAIKQKASDVHLVKDQSPIMRIEGKLVPQAVKPLTGEEVKGIVYGFLNDRQKESFEKNLELDTAYATEFGRFRVNIHKERGELGAAFRHIPSEIKSLEELGLPLILKELALKPNGLVLVTGPTGTGKSTTLAAMIDIINKEKSSMIISLEDPIEYIHNSQKSIVRQREVGFDTLSFLNGLKETLRQDVNVILVGEIRDLDSISVALTAAETGHLVLTTLHTSDATSAINRIIDVFPSNQQQQIRIQLAEVLRGIVSQVLIPRKDKPGRVAAAEILVCTPAVSGIIRQGNIEQIRSVLQTAGQEGMQTMDKSLENLYTAKIISKEHALMYAKDRNLFK